MTSTVPQPTVTRAPGSVVLVRVLVCVQAAVALVGTSMTIFLALLAFAWVDGTGLGLAVAGLIGLGALMAAYGVALITAVNGLRRGAENVRTRLIVLESVLLGGVLLLTDGVSEQIGFGSLPMPAVVLGITAAASLVALLQPSCRAYTAR